jgi:hypothetical protein
MWYVRQNDKYYYSQKSWKDLVITLTIINNIVIRSILFSNKLSTFAIMKNKIKQP